MKNEVIIKGWVARNSTGKILFFKGEEAPRRPLFKSSPKQWYGSKMPTNGIPLIPNTAFPEIKWESEPKEVEITIKIKEE